MFLIFSPFYSLFGEILIVSTKKIASSEEKRNQNDEKVGFGVGVGLCYCACFKTMLQALLRAGLNCWCRVGLFRERVSLVEKLLAGRVEVEE